MKSFIIIIVCTGLLPFSLWAQNVSVDIKKGNAAYKKGDFQKAIEYYKTAVAGDPKNGLAQFNLGNAYQKINESTLAEKVYDEAASNSILPDLKSKAAYNKGLAFIRQKNLPEAIEAFKQSLRITPEDDDARENLQKALNDLQQQQQSQNNHSQQQQSKDQRQKQSPQQNKLTEQRADHLLNQLRDQEKQLQRKLQKQKPYSGQQEKDW